MFRVMEEMRGWRPCAAFHGPASFTTFRSEHPQPVVAGIPNRYWTMYGLREDEPDTVGTRRGRLRLPFAPGSHEAKEAPLDQLLPAHYLDGHGLRQATTLELSTYLILQ